MGTYIGPPVFNSGAGGVTIPPTRCLTCYGRVTFKGYPALGTCAKLQYHFYNATCPYRCIHESLLVLYQLGNYYGRYTAPAMETPSALPLPDSRRPHLPRKSAEEPKKYFDKPLTPSPQSSPDPLNPPAVAGPSSYANAAAAGGAFQPVISRHNRNHRNIAGSPPPTPLPTEAKARQLVHIRHDTEIPLTASPCMSIVNNICSRLRPTTCPGSIGEVKSSARGNLVLTTDRSVLAQDLWPYRKHIIHGLNDSHLEPFDLTLYQTRLPVYISNVPLSYPRGGDNRSWHPDDWDTTALERLKADMSSWNAVEAVDRLFAVGTLAGFKSKGQAHCAFVVNLIRNPASEELARSALAAIAGCRVFCRERFPDAH